MARLVAGGAGGGTAASRRATARSRASSTGSSKPAGEPYATFLARLPRAECWQRQLVLGPAPEFCVLGPAPEGVDALAVRARVVDDAT